jgi:hypothetical protein
MSRHQSDFTEDQRTAVARAAVDYLMSARVIAAAAHAGELGVPSFTISPSTVSLFAREERERRRAEEQPEGGHNLDVQVRLDDLWDRCIDLAEQAVGELEDEAGEPDVGRLRQLVGLTRLLAKQPGPATPERRSSVERQTSPLLARLAAASAPEDGDSNGNAA